MSQMNEARRYDPIASPTAIEASSGSGSTSEDRICPRAVASLTDDPAVKATIPVTNSATTSNAWSPARTTAGGPAASGICKAPVVRTNT